MIYIEKYNKKQSFYHQKDYTVQIIRPDHILKKVSEIAYGPRKV